MRNAEQTSHRINITADYETKIIVRHQNFYSALAFLFYAAFSARRTRGAKGFTRLKFQFFFYSER